MFSPEGETTVELPLDVVRITIPLLLYFAFISMRSLWRSWETGTSYEQSVSLWFTAASNDFELASPWPSPLVGASMLVEHPRTPECPHSPPSQALVRDVVPSLDLNRVLA